MRNQKGLAPARGAIEATLLSAELMQALRPHMAKVHWAKIVGPQVASVTQVEAVRAGSVLVVRVKNSVWANELTLLKDDIIKRLNQKLGGKVITDLHFKASGLARTKTKLEPVMAKAPSPGEIDRLDVSVVTRAKIAAAVQKIENEALRSQVERTLLKFAQANEWKKDQGWLPCAVCDALTEFHGQEIVLCPACTLSRRNRGVQTIQGRPTGQP